MAKNEWIIEGYLGNYPRSGVTKNGLPWYGNTVSTTNGKDKETGKYIKEYINFTLFGDDCDIVDSFQDGTIVRVTGRPEINSYVKKDGEKVDSLQVKFAKVEIISEGQAQPAPVEDYSDESDEPF